MLRNYFFPGGLSLLLVLAGPALAWSRADYAKYSHKNYTAYAAFRGRIDFNAVDYDLLAAAIFFETNRQRVDQGLPAFKPSAALERAATGHSRDMATRNFFSHDSPVRGRETMSKRLALEGVTTGMRGENIASTFGIEYEPGKPVYNPEQNGGFFSYAFKGDPILPHTYSGMAEFVVDQWMNSPGHRSNILNKGFVYLGAGAAYFEKKEFYNMPHFMFTQNFGSEDAP